MKKPDPTRFTGSDKRRADKLEMRGFSAPLSPEPSPRPEKKPKKKLKQPRDRDTMTPRHHDTTVSRYHDTIIELVRKAVKEFGKEAATHRFTAEEKKAIADILYTYQGQGIKTSENQVARIAINFIITDYKENAGNSILDRVLKALNE